MAAKKNENKTRETSASVAGFIASIASQQRRSDTVTLIDIMSRVTGERPRMWGASMVGFGHYHYKYESGREGESFLVGFSPRKTSVSIYVMPGFEQHAELLERVGPHEIGKSCLYVKSTEAVDLAALEELVKLSVEEMRRRYPPDEKGPVAVEATRP